MNTLDDRMISLMSAQTAALGRIALALETLAMTNAPAPNFVRPLADYADFDYSAIGAVVKQYDGNGPTELDWGGYSWTRRSPQNKFGEAIWFSRSIGKDATTGDVKFARLITFKKFSGAEPLPRKVEALVSTSKVEVKVVPTVPSYKPEPDLSAESESELERHFGPNPRAEVAPRKPQTELPTPAGDEVWPTTEAEYTQWAAEKKINGKETHSALGQDAKSWMRQNQKGWADVAQTIAAMLGK